MTNKKPVNIPAAGGMAVSGINIARACAEIILECGPEGDRAAIDALKASIMEFCSHMPSMEPDTLAVATITKTIGSVVDCSNIRDINLTGMEGKGEA